MFNSLKKDVYKELLDERIVFIDDEINSKSASEIVAQLLYLNSQNNNDIVLYINSIGGSVSDGLMIYDTIKYLKCDVQTICLGQACSMAGILLMAAGTKGKRKMLKHSKIMLHDVSGGAVGNFSNIMSTTNEIVKTRNILIDLIKNNCKLSNKEINELLKNDFWLNSEEALKKGVIDNIIE